MTTKIADLIVDLQHAKGPDRLLDTAIAVLFGYQQKDVHVPGEKAARMHWFRPGRGTPVRVPRYTGNIDVARQLAETVVPGCAAGFTWGPAHATAKINDGPTSTGATPPLALCIAALNAKYAQDKFTADTGR
jgi:hypothetical protein